MIRGYLLGDSLKVRVQKKQAEEAACFAAYFDNIKAYTLTDKTQSNVKAVFGYRINRAECAEAYALVGFDIGIGGLLETVHFFKRKIPLLMRQNQVECLQVSIQKDFLQALKLVCLLGFEFRAELPDFFGQRDYQLFERRNK